MASTEISMRDLFPACVEILGRRRVPMHYRELTMAALRALEVPLSFVSVNKESENVREKLLIAKRRGAFYTGAPLFAGALRHWYAAEDQLQFTLDAIEIPGHAQAAADGAFISLMRANYMIKNSPLLRNTERLNKARASGLVLEEHIDQGPHDATPDPVPMQLWKPEKAHLRDEAFIRRWQRVQARRRGNCSSRYSDNPSRYLDKLAFPRLVR